MPDATVDINCRPDKFTFEVHESVELNQLNVLSVVAFKVIPPPSAVVFVGDAIEPSSIFLSSTETVVELIVVVVPLTLKSPAMFRFPLIPTPPVTTRVPVEVESEDILPVNVVAPLEVRAVNAPVDLVLAPIEVLLIVPPATEIEEEACVAIVPRPRDDRAADADSKANAVPLPTIKLLFVGLNALISVKRVDDACFPPNSVFRLVKLSSTCWFDNGEPPTLRLIVAIYIPIY